MIPGTISERSLKQAEHPFHHFYRVISITRGAGVYPPLFIEKLLLSVVRMNFRMLSLEKEMPGWSRNV
jgi:hypothetical protein